VLGACVGFLRYNFNPARIFMGDTGSLFLGFLLAAIGIKLRFDDFRTVTRDLSIDEPTQDARRIRRAAGECLRRIALSRRLRLLGVRASALSDVDAALDTPGGRQLDLIGFGETDAAPSPAAVSRAPARSGPAPG